MINLRHIRSLIMSAYRRQFEHDGLALLHFRFPPLQKEHAFIASEKLYSAKRRSYEGAIPGNQTYEGCVADPLSEVDCLDM